MYISFVCDMQQEMLRQLQCLDIVYISLHILVHISLATDVCVRGHHMGYAMASTSRPLKIIGLFCKRAL